MPLTDTTDDDLGLLPPDEFRSILGKRSREEFEGYDNYNYDDGDGYYGYDYYDDDDDNLELLLRPLKKQKLEEETALKEWVPRLTRSNSIDRLGSLLPISERYTGSTALSKADMKDFSVMAVFSREAFGNFGKKWKVRMNADPLELATLSSKKVVSSADATKLLSLQSRTVLGTDFQAQVQGLLENKTSPHVIAVIEGKEEMSSLSLKSKVGDDLIDVPYTRVTYIQGTNAKGSSDNKQSMSVYVRDDMKSVYSFSEETVAHSGGKKINAVGVNYATSDGTQYRSLVVHIPNEFIKTGGDRDATHASFQDYADAERDKSSPVIVTSYFGDTNYASEMRPYSSPSMGGHSSTGSGDSDECDHSIPAQAINPENRHFRGAGRAQE